MTEHHQYLLSKCQKYLEGKVTRGDIVKIQDYIYVLLRRDRIDYEEHQLRYQAKE